MKSISKSKQFDVYSDPRVPFDVATWARGHRFDVTAVGMTKKLVKLDDLKNKLAKLEDEIEQEEIALQTMVDQAKGKMEVAHGV